MSQNSNTIGAVLTGGSIGGGLTQWVTQNSTIISLSLTAVSCFAGVLFLFLNWRENKRRNDIAQRALDSSGG